MSRRRFLRTTALAGVGAMTGSLGMPRPASARQRTVASATKRPIRILMGGYGPSSTDFSLALRRIGERLESRFGDDVEVKYVYNILDFGYRAEDINWLVEDGVLTLGYQATSYFTERLPDLSVADLPFLFSDVKTARDAVDGRFGQLLAAKLEAGTNYRILGYFESGFSHVSNRLRPIRRPADMKGMRLRVRPSKVQTRTFELLGAEPVGMDLAEFISGIKAGALDAQENPFSSTVTYGVHKFHRFHTATKHFYLSRAIFLHRPSFRAWPERLQEEMRAAVKEAVVFQRELHVKEEDEVKNAITKEGGEILELTAQERESFVRAVARIYDEARREYGRDLLGLVGL